MKKRCVKFDIFWSRNEETQYEPQNQVLPAREQSEVCTETNEVCLKELVEPSFSDGPDESLMFFNTFLPVYKNN